MAILSCMFNACDGLICMREHGSVVLTLGCNKSTACFLPMQGNKRTATQSADAAAKLGQESAGSPDAIHDYIVTRLLRCCCLITPKHVVPEVCSSEQYLKVYIGSCTYSSRRLQQ